MAQNAITAQQVIYGSHGELWIDGNYTAEVLEVKGTVTFDKLEVKITKKMGKHYKYTGWTGKGSVKLNKVDSYFIKEYAADAKRGIQHPVTIIAKLSDPDALGEERIAFKDCLFDSFDLANWKVGGLGEESMDFTFSDYEILDSI